MSKARYGASRRMQPVYPGRAALCPCSHLISTILSTAAKNAFARARAGIRLHGLRGGLSNRRVFVAGGRFLQSRASRFGVRANSAKRLGGG